MLTRIVAETLSGKAALHYRPEGVSWSIECPAKEAIVS